MRKLDWLVVKDNWLQETANFWKSAPEVAKGEVKATDIKTEVFFFPAAQVAEYEGSFTNTQRMLQWHYKAAEPPGDCRTDSWFYYQLGKRLKAKYANSTRPRDQGWNNLVWDYEHDTGERNAKGRARCAEDAEGDQRLFHGDTRQHCAGFADLKDDGSTTCASWIYCGVFPAPDQNLARRGPRARCRTGAERQLGLGVAGQPAHHVQPRVGRSRGQALERAEEVDLVGCGIDKWAGRANGWLRRARLHRRPKAPNDARSRAGQRVWMRFRAPIRSS